MRAHCWFPTVFALALSQGISGQITTIANPNLLPLHIEVQLDKSVKLSKFKSGDVTEGALVRDVYSADRRMFAAGSQVRLTVDHIERRRKAVNDHWPWLVQLFVPRYEKVPSFKESTVQLPDGTKSVLQVSLVSIGARTEVYSESSKRHKQHEGKDGRMSRIAENPDRPYHSHRSPEIMVSLEAREGGNHTVRENGESANTSSARAITVPAGSACRVLLLTGVSASKSRAGDIVQARLLEPIIVGAHVAVPEGSVLEGHVLRAKPPRWLSRAGSLSLIFTRMILPDGAWFPISASPTSVELKRGSHTRIDAEGRLQGDRPGLTQMLIDGGVTAGIAKETDDATQLIIEAVLSGATDASTAGTARIAGMVVSGIFMVTRNGRDVILPNFTDMNITLTRPVALSVQVASSGDQSKRR